MNEQRAFTVVVTGCKDCPFKRHEFQFSYCDMVLPQMTSIELYANNYKAITPSCPMWSEAKPMPAPLKMLSDDEFEEVWIECSNADGNNDEIVMSEFAEKIQQAFAAKNNLTLERL
jgi:hypothetical protein